MGLHGGLPKLGVPFRGPHNKDYSILGSILGSGIMCFRIERGFRVGLEVHNSCSQT